MTFLTPFILSQILIGLAFICDVFSWQQKKREKILAILSVSCFLIATHFVLLEQWTGAVLVYLGMFRFLVSIWSIDKKWMWIFLFLNLVATFFTYESYIDLIALTANIVFTIAAFEKTDKKLRLITMSATCIWIVYNILVFTPSGIFLETFFLLSNVVGYYRFYLKKTS